LILYLGYLVFIEISYTDPSAPLTPQAASNPYHFTPLRCDQGVGLGGHLTQPVICKPVRALLPLGVSNASDHKKIHSLTTPPLLGMIAISPKKMAIEQNRKCGRFWLPSEDERGRRLIACFLLLPATLSGACARCKNLKARSRPVSLTATVLTKQNDGPFNLFR